MARMTARVVLIMASFVPDCGFCLRIPVKATGESGRRRPPNPVEGDQVRGEPLDARLMFIGNVAY
jgi:hypothetical protein